MSSLASGCGFDLRGAFRGFMAVTFKRKNLPHRYANQEVFRFNPSSHRIRVEFMFCKCRQSSRLWQAMQRRENGKEGNSSNISGNRQFSDPCQIDLNHINRRASLTDITSFRWPVP